MAYVAYAVKMTLLIALVGLAALFAVGHGASEARQGREPTQSGGNPAMEEAMFAAGCFWHVEETFRHVDGVLDTEVGYTGGHVAAPTYEDVCSHTTGHAEAVRVTFDPDKVSYERLLEVFWHSHDPTTPHRQGLDIGSQYRSAIFYKTPEQKEAAENSKRALEESGRYGVPILTEIVPASKFWRAEEYHQRYLEKHGGGFCPVD